VLEGSQSRLKHARALTDLGAALRRASHRADARDPLRQGLDIAHRCGATALAARARTELLATGARPRRIALHGRDALTATERRIADMAAGGQSTPEIAQALFVTTKTIETHLGHTYQQLNIHSRNQLVNALRQ
jgi:DNA-binding CsgD family transcriptional regulator